MRIYTYTFMWLCTCIYMLPYNNDDHITTSTCWHIHFTSTHVCIRTCLHKLRSPHIGIAFAMPQGHSNKKTWFAALAPFNKMGVGGVISISGVYIYTTKKWGLKFKPPRPTGFGR